MDFKQYFKEPDNKSRDLDFNMSFGMPQQFNKDWTEVNLKLANLKGKSDHQNTKLKKMIK